jgi:pilus assembly protein CpaE
MSMMPLSAALVIGTRALWEQAHACVQNLPVRIAVEQNEPAEADALLDRIERHRVDVVLVEGSRVSIPLDEFVGRLKNTAGQPAVFVLHPEPSPDRILDALRAGANEFLYPPLAEPLRDAFERLSQTRSKSGTGTSGELGKVFGFISARGGCGATTFAIHVASNIAKQNKEPMLVADFDFDAGLLRFLMKSKNTYSVRDALDNLHRMDSSLWKGLVSSHPNQIDFIPAPDEVAAKRHPGREEMTHLMRFIRSMYPVTIVDFGRSVSMAALDSLPELDALYLVTTIDRTTLEHTRNAIQMLEERGLPAARLKVLLNRVPDKGVPDRAGIESLIGRPCAATFRNDFMALYDAYSEGSLLQQGTPLAKEFLALANSIRARAAGERETEEVRGVAAPVRDSGKRWFSFFQRAQA